MEECLHTTSCGFTKEAAYGKKILTGKLDLEDAIREAIDYCVVNHIMETFFRENKDEVMKSMLLDYTWERREELIRAEEYEDGLAEEADMSISEFEKNMLQEI